MTENDLTPRQRALAGEFVKEGHSTEDAIQMASASGGVAQAAGDCDDLNRFVSGVREIQEYLEAKEPRIGDATFVCEALLAGVGVVAPLAQSGCGDPSCPECAYGQGQTTAQLSSTQNPCPNCNDTKRATYFGEQGWQHEERHCHICAASSTDRRSSPIKEATPAQHFDLPKGEPARFVRDGVLETCQCRDCSALSSTPRGTP